jgi:hypothetical protein
MFYPDNPRERVGDNLKPRLLSLSSLYFASRDNLGEKPIALRKLQRFTLLETRGKLKT